VEFKLQHATLEAYRYDGRVATERGKRLVVSRFVKRREKLRIEPLYRNDSGDYACLTTLDLCRRWQNVTLIITGATTELNILSRVSTSN